MDEFCVKLLITKICEGRGSYIYHSAPGSWPIEAFSQMFVGYMSE